EISYLNNLGVFTVHFDTLKYISNNLYSIRLKTLAYTGYEFSDSLINLKNLQDLRVDIMGMKKLQKVITSLNKLQYLMLPSDVLSIPTSISNLVNLKTLNISSTKYEEKIMYKKNIGIVSDFFLDSINNLKKMLPSDCVIITSGNI